MRTTCFDFRSIAPDAPGAGRRQVAGPGPRGARRSPARGCFGRGCRAGGLLSLVVAASALSACAGVGPRGTVNVPQLMLRDIDGRAHYLSDYIGEKVVVMAFWATWCMPCRNELNLLQKVYAEHADQGLAVLAVAADGPETIARVRPFVKQSGWSFVVLLDTETRAAALFNPRKILPMLHIFDRAGRIVYSHTTFQPGQAAALKRKILSTLQSEGAGAQDEGAAEGGE